MHENQKKEANMREREKGNDVYVNHLHGLLTLVPGDQSDSVKNHSTGLEPQKNGKSQSLVEGTDLQCKQVQKKVNGDPKKMGSRAFMNSTNGVSEKDFPREIHHGMDTASCGVVRALPM